MRHLRSARLPFSSRLGLRPRSNWSRLKLCALASGLVRPGVCGIANDWYAPWYGGGVGSECRDDGGRLSRAVGAGDADRRDSRGRRLGRGDPPALGSSFWTVKSSPSSVRLSKLDTLAMLIRFCAATPAPTAPPPTIEW